MSCEGDKGHNRLSELDIVCLSEVLLNLLLYFVQLLKLASCDKSPSLDQQLYNLLIIEGKLDARDLNLLLLGSFVYRFFGLDIPDNLFL